MSLKDRHAGKMQQLMESVLDGPGELSSDTRRAIAEERYGEIPAAFRSYLEKIPICAWTITDEDVQALRQEGVSEDQIFEATIAASLGAGLKRLRAGLAALEA